MELDRWLALGILILVLIAGWFQIFRRITEHRKKLERVIEYQLKFVRLIESIPNKGFSRIWLELRGMDRELLTWLILKSEGIQGILSLQGLVTYTDPIRRERISNYPLIINTLSNLQSDKIQLSQIEMVENALLRYIGLNQEIHETQKKALRNPIKWFTMGVGTIIDLPIQLLRSFEIIGIGFAYKLKNNFIYKMLRGIVALIGLVSGLITIFTGWDNFITTRRKKIFSTLRAAPNCNP